MVLIIYNFLSNKQNIGYIKYSTFGSIWSNFYNNAKYPGASGPSHWQDPDMLCINNPGMNIIEYKTQMSLWCMSAAPLWISTDLNNISTDVLNILSNKEVIDIDQDKLGSMCINLQGNHSTNNNNGQIWWRQLTPKSNETTAVAVLLVNIGDETLNIWFEFIDIGIIGPGNVRDLWAHMDYGYLGSINTTVNSHDVLMMRISQ